MKNNKLLFSAFLFITSTVSLAQGTVDDYKRAYSLRQKFNASNVYYSDVTPSWIDSTNTFWYVRKTPAGKIYTFVDANKKNKSDLFNHKKLAKKLSDAIGREVKSDNLDLMNLAVSKGCDTLRFIFNSSNWIYTSRNGNLINKGKVIMPSKQKHWMEVDNENEGEPVTSPDGKYVAFVKNHNIYVRNISTGKEKQLSIDGTLSNYYSVYISWSPDSRKVASCKIRPVHKRYVYYVESSPKDQLQPKLHKQEYAKPGDELPFRVPCIYDVNSGESVIPSTELFIQQYDLSYPVWNDDSKAITFEYNQRGHQVYRVLELSSETGKVRTIVEEAHDKYVNYTRHFRHDLKNGKEMIWMSERDNWNHLYMYDRKESKPTHQITKGEWYVREVIKVDEENKHIYFSANGVQEDEDPYFIRYYRIDFDGNNMICLTPDKGHHKAWFSTDMKYLVDVYSTVADAPITVLRNANDGRIVMPIEKANIDKLLEQGWKAPEVFVAKGRDNKTDMWGLIVRPTNFDPSKKYPVIEYIYQGPGDQYVPKSFMPYNWWMTSIAELGFVVVMVDGMGTSFRSREFENVCYKNLKDAALPDHIAWIKAAAKKYSYIDSERVGIYGCSAGGQESTNAVLLYPEFYKAAYSACGCHDNRMDKIWWNELWMGYPIGNQYIECSNVENAHLLSRPLMLVVGEMDDNVDPSSTMQVVNALINNNKDFELVVIPGARHTMGENFGEHKRYDFFVKHLLEVNPPKWNEIGY